MSDRENAFGLLQRVELHDEFASPLLAGRPGSVREIVLGVLRWRSRLDEVIARLSNRPSKKIDQRVLQILRTAIYELMFMNSPAHAVVNDAVSLAARQANRSRGFVNAVLRKAAQTDLRKLPADEVAHPRWLLEKWMTLFGEERAMAIARANQQPSRADLLVNTRVISIGEADRIVRDSSRSELVTGVLRLHGSSAVLRQEIEAGLLHPMDEGSALIASLVRAEKHTVLDAAAAPGGKSLVLSLAGHRVVSNDISLARLRLVQRAATRMGLSHPLVAGDAIRPPYRRQFDTVLLDAPCSGTGTIRKNPEIKWRLDPNCFERFAALQQDLLAALLPLTRQELIYSTCSLEPEENDQVVAHVLANHPEFERIDLGERLGPAARLWLMNGILRLTPESGADGFTAFLLRRKSA